MLKNQNIIKEFENHKQSICIVGLGYVGLPLAVLLNTKYNVIGFDINIDRIEELKQGKDSTLEVDESKLKKSTIQFSNNPEDIKKALIIIITVPTPVDEHKNPDLTPVVKSTAAVGRYMAEGSIVVYESTVYPGVTEEICVPILEKESGLKWKKDFFVGYSPERINPGDKNHTVEKIRKIVSGDIPETLEILSSIYGSVIEAGIFKAQNIRTAEAAKVIENIQRDLNIALINELSLIFHKMDIDTREVLEAAGTKWNFIKFEPGLVGGHCIGVDPYYLTFKAESLGYHPQVILAGRRINDSMAGFVAQNTVKLLINADRLIKGSKILIAGLTFKENTPDIRNTKVIDIYKELLEYGASVTVYDPVADKKKAHEEYGIILMDSMSGLEKTGPYDAIILAVKHSVFLNELNISKLMELSKDKKVILIDIKGMYDKKNAVQECYIYWRL
jgi:UDP-N-acetyl-D-galactosamine dehydrogenase